MASASIKIISDTVAGARGASRYTTNFKFPSLPAHVRSKQIALCHPQCVSEQDGNCEIRDHRPYGQFTIYDQEEYFHAPGNYMHEPAASAGERRLSARRRSMCVRFGWSFPLPDTASHTAVA